jgi:hypothetical protein
MAIIALEETLARELRMSLRVLEEKLGGKRYIFGKFY